MQLTVDGGHDEQSSAQDSAQATKKLYAWSHPCHSSSAVVARSGTNALAADFDELDAYAIAWPCSSRNTACWGVSKSVSFAPVEVLVHGYSFDSQATIPHPTESFHDVKSVPNKGEVNIRHVL